MKLLSSIILLISLLTINNSYSQGCSDAGFCTIGNLNQQGSDFSVSKKQKLSFLFPSGIGDEGVYVFTPGIQYDNRLSKQWAIQARITANYASGNLGSAAGLGDIFLSSIYTAKTRGVWAKSFLLGAKVPLNTGDIREDNKPLPMQYQSSLGTYDIIAGFTIANKKWLFATAIQQPVSGINRNTFLPAYWNTPEAYKYSPTNDFNRKGDVLLRAGYEINSAKTWRLNIGLLGIYHLGKDTYVDGNVSNKPIKLIGSEGLTLNGTAAASYRLNSKLLLGLTAGVPFIVRDIRPDGLTRKFVLSPELIFHF